MKLSGWVKQLKQHLHRILMRMGHEPTQTPGHALASFWQPGFVDHLLRSGESYTQKWYYVRDNPVRAGLVTSAEDWPYAGEIIRIDRV
jgi:hypothetical protein